MRSWCAAPEANCSICRSDPPSRSSIPFKTLASSSNFVVPAGERKPLVEVRRRYLRGLPRHRRDRLQGPRGDKPEKEKDRRQATCRDEDGVAERLARRRLEWSKRHSGLYRERGGPAAGHSNPNALRPHPDGLAFRRDGVGHRLDATRFPSSPLSTPRDRHLHVAQVLAPREDPPLRVANLVEVGVRGEFVWVGGSARA